MLSHLKSPNATLTFVPESAIDDDTLTRSNFDDAIALGPISKKTITTFKCSAHMNIIGEAMRGKIPLTPGYDSSGGALYSVFLRLSDGQTFPDWIKPTQVASVVSKNFGSFSGVVKFRMMRSIWAIEEKKGPDFFVQEGTSR
ncbi:MAG: hypothetical protein ACRCYP_01870 [Alphaproteobacteria bacterium]